MRVKDFQGMVSRKVAKEAKAQREVKSKKLKYKNKKGSMRVKGFQGMLSRKVAKEAKAQREVKSKKLKYKSKKGVCG